MTQTVTIDGPAPLTGTFFEAATPRAVAVLNGATGVPHRFYRHFAAWLAETQDVSCLIYDYRDFGASARGPVRDVTASMLDWGLSDTQVARDWLEARANGLPVWLMGHSLGGLMLARHQRTKDVARVITVCTGPVHTTDHPWPFQATVRALWFVVGPLSTASFGYVPKQVSGLGSDIPGPVFKQWKRWCTTRGYPAKDPCIPAAPIAAFSCPVRTVSLSDDTSVPPSAVARMTELYPGTETEHLALTPQEFGLKKVGHIDAFRPENAKLWPALIA
ncbi:alpha/beta fold hydrolase [Aliiroseovarius marinus]|uniref:alpha/beta hydrolase family protein n=1 Tax=Aliiroseovarius marinus TaxID=2500159 RepID=UPI00105DE582|nr:alpha/beta fold hydrolase [Aliiroseovarius marinus]